MKKLLLAVTLLCLALPAQASQHHTMVELHDRYKVLQVGELHLNNDYHVLQIMCFLNKGKRLVYQDLTTGEFEVISSYRFAKQHQYMGLEQVGEVTVWKGTTPKQEEL
jgi:hypothetical protein